VVKERKNQFSWYDLGRLSQGVGEVKPNFKPKDYRYANFFSLITRTHLVVFNQCNN
jgi:hypothetical protein